MVTKISVVTVAFNSDRTIVDTLHSVGAQDYDSVEYIVVDGASTDRTIDIVKEQGDIVDILITGPDHGLYDAMNKGIRAASGEVVGFLNSDDFYAGNRVIREVAEFMDEQNLDACYGDLIYVNPKRTDRTMRYWRSGPPSSWAWGWHPPHPTFFCRRKIYEKYGCFNTKYSIAADYELMLRFMVKYKINVGYLPKILVHMRSGGKSNSLKGILRANIEIINAYRDNSLRYSPLLFFIKPTRKLLQFIHSSHLSESRSI